MNVPLWVWILTIGLTGVLLLVDVVIIGRRPHVPSMAEAGRYLAIYLALAFFFGVGVWYFSGADFAAQFYAGWLTEYSLSVDNLFVFLIIMAKFGVPEKLQQTALMVGIVIALILRGIFIAVGAAAINEFSWIFYVFGAFLIYTAVKLATGRRQRRRRVRGEPLPEVGRDALPGNQPVAGHQAVRHVERQPHHHADVHRHPRLGTTDLLFALDSIPAIFGLTQEPFLVLTANIFALMGLRQLYFLIGGLLKRLVYLGIGLAILLSFIGVKLILHAVHVNELPFINGGHPVAAPRTSRSVSRSRSSSPSWRSRPSRACSRAARTTGPSRRRLTARAARWDLTGSWSRPSARGGRPGPPAHHQPTGRDDARHTEQLAGLRCWPSTTSPASAATAGSRLSRMPKTWAASRRRAISSREYGRTDDSTAMAAPRQSASGVHSADPPVSTPTGATSTAAIVIAMASPSSWANRAPVRCAEDDVCRPRAACGQGESQPGQVNLCPRRAGYPGDQDDADRRTGDGEQVLASVGQHRGQHQGTDELDGDRHADGYPGQRAVEEEVHHRQDRAEGADHQPVRGGSASQPGPDDDEQDGRSDGEPQRHRAEHADQRDQRGGQRPTELDRDDGCQDQQRRGDPPGHPRARPRCRHWTGASAGTRPVPDEGAPGVLGSEVPR